MDGPFMPSAAIWQVSNHTPPYIPSSRSKLAKSVITKKDNEATKWSLICLNSPIIQSKKIKLVTFVHWSHLVEKSFSRFLKVPTTGWQGHTRRTLNISDELTCFKKHSKPPHQCPCLVAASTFLHTRGAERCVVEIKLMPLIGSKIPDARSQHRRETSAGLLPCIQGNSPDTRRSKYYKSVKTNCCNSRVKPDLSSYHGILRIIWLRSC